MADDGTSRALGAAPHQTLDGPLTDRLVAAADRDGTIASHDLLYAPDAAALTEAWSAAGALAADLETGALAAVAARHGIAFAAIVTIAARRRAGRAATTKRSPPPATPRAARPRKHSRDSGPRRPGATRTS